MTSNPHRLQLDENSGSRNRPKNKTSKRIKKRPAKATPRKRYFVFGSELQLGLYKESKSPHNACLSPEQSLEEHCGKEYIDIMG